MRSSRLSHVAESSADTVESAGVSPSVVATTPRDPEETGERRCTPNSEGIELRNADAPASAVVVLHVVSGDGREGDEGLLGASTDADSVRSDPRAPSSECPTGTSQRSVSPQVKLSPQEAPSVSAELTSSADTPIIDVLRTATDAIAFIFGNPNATASASAVPAAGALIFADVSSHGDIAKPREHAIVASGPATAATVVSTSAGDTSTSAVPSQADTLSSLSPSSPRTPPRRSEGSRLMARAQPVPLEPPLNPQALRRSLLLPPSQADTPSTRLFSVLLPPNLADSLPLLLLPPNQADLLPPRHLLLVPPSSTSTGATLAAAVCDAIYLGLPEEDD